MGMEPYIVDMYHRENHRKNWKKLTKDEILRDAGQRNPDRPTSGLWYLMAIITQDCIAYPKTYEFANTSGYTVTVDNKDLSKTTFFSNNTGLIGDQERRWNHVSLLI